MRIPVGIDPAETWPLDLCAEAQRQAIETWRALAAAADAEVTALPEEKRAEARARAAGARAELALAEKSLAEYVAGTGPIFTVGWLPGAKRAEINGMVRDALALTSQRERAAAEHAWRVEVVRWAVRGHSGLKNAAGAEMPFEGEQRSLGGETYLVPTERQIGRYGPFLVDLALVCLAKQKLPDTEKNA